MWNEKSQPNVWTMYVLQSMCRIPQAADPESTDDQM